MGSEVNREVLLSMGQYVMRSVEREAKKNAGRGRKWHNSFKKGAVLGVMDTVNKILLERQKDTPVVASGKDLMVFNDKEIALNDDYIISVLKLNLTNRTASFIASSRDGRDAGRSFGSRVSLSDQIGGGSATKLLR